MRLNLHLHTTYSDGVCTPEEIVELQKKDNIEAMAVTDHDTISGIERAMQAGKKSGIKVIPGIELSSFGAFEIHILGYNFDYLNPEFIEKLDYVKNLRKLRIGKTVEILQNIGIDLNTEKLNFDKCNLGRMHVARLMVEQGYVSSVSEAFHRYLGEGQRAHVKGYRLRPFEAVELIREFGGIPVLAHPVFVPKDKLDLLVTGLIDYGLGGLECYYSSHNETDTKKFLAMAKKYRLITTCGTDYHDENSYLSPNYKNNLVDNRSLKKLNLL